MARPHQTARGASSVVWTEEERLRLWRLRNGHHHLSWNNFYQLGYFGDRSLNALQSQYSKLSKERPLETSLAGSQVGSRARSSTIPAKRSASPRLQASQARPPKRLQVDNNEEEDRSDDSDSVADDDSSGGSEEDTDDDDGGHNNNSHQRKPEQISQSLNKGQHAISRVSQTKTGQSTVTPSKPTPDDRPGTTKRDQQVPEHTPATTPQKGLQPTSESVQTVPKPRPTRIGSPLPPSSSSTSPPAQNAHVNTGTPTLLPIQPPARIPPARIPPTTGSIQQISGASPSVAPNRRITPATAIPTDNNTRARTQTPAPIVSYAGVAKPPPAPIAGLVNPTTAPQTTGSTQQSQAAQQATATATAPPPRLRSLFQTSEHPNRASPAAQNSPVQNVITPTPHLPPGNGIAATTKAPTIATMIPLHPAIQVQGQGQKSATATPKSLIPLPYPAPQANTTPTFQPAHPSTQPNLPRPSPNPIQYMPPMQHNSPDAEENMQIAAYYLARSISTQTRADITSVTQRLETLESNQTIAMTKHDKLQKQVGPLLKRIEYLADYQGILIANQGTLQGYLATHAKRIEALTSIIPKGGMSEDKDIGICNKGGVDEALSAVTERLEKMEKDFQVVDMIRGLVSGTGQEHGH
ncbi:hypothetical protein BDW59DRAFT_156331 [Aspergillus cavernicola]|uniref:Myb-like domain-containing protein n=1 Tax=Aspergillus cavernicola TaxID=176166 RepID=A0ABR4J2X9_9EURO